MSWKNLRPPYPNELYHHGIKGMSWGVRNGPPYPLSSEQKSQVKLSPFDKAYNLNKWGKTKDTNILYITGYSGSGKSTLANQIAKKNNAEYIELDRYLSNHTNTQRSQSFEKYLKASNPKYYNYLKPKNFEAVLNNMYSPNGNKAIVKDFMKSRDQVINHDIPNYGKYMYGSKKIVVEGIHLYNPGDFGSERKMYSVINGKPLIIKGTSNIKSLYRQTVRDMDPKYGITDGTKKDNIKFVMESIKARAITARESTKAMRQYKKAAKDLYKKHKSLTNFSNKLI